MPRQEVRGKMRFFAGRTANNLILPTSYCKNPAARANLRAYADGSNIATVPSTTERLLLLRAAESDVTTMMICNMVMVIFKRKNAAEKLSPT